MQALPSTARAVCLDISKEFTDVACHYWQLAGVADRVDLKIGPALESLRELERESTRFDFAFIDADKPNYPAYYECCLRLVRKGGLIAVDNVLWSGKVADLSIDDEFTMILRQFNDDLRQDDRIDLALAPIADGLTLARVR